MDAPGVSPGRAARKEAARRTRKRRIRIGLAAAVFAAAGFLLLFGALRPRADLSASAPAPSAAPTPFAGMTPAVTPAPSAAPTPFAGMTPAVTPAPAAAPTPFAGMTPAVTPAPSAAPTLFAGMTPAVTPAPAAAPTLLTISAAGDITLGGDAGGRTYAAFAGVWKKNGADYFFQNVRPIFEEDDLTIVNLEGPLTTATSHREKEFAFKGDPSYARILASGSVEAANLANNHAKDYYGKGLTDTANALKKAEISPFGWGNSPVLEIKGVKVGLCGFGVWYVSVDQLKKQVAALKKRCDLVIVSIHGGEEGEGRATKAQRNYARAAVNAGAALVLGHHPHVVGGIEVYKGAVIAYSLGNFCFGGNLNPADKDTFILRQTFAVDAGGVTPLETLVIPCAISGSKKKNDYQPVPLSGADAERVLDRIEKLSKGFDTPADLTASRARLTG